ncbi:MAG TPA: hypothetical protein PK264_16485 [Hyphomicrobiaceae bacterium]|nr:hypothetical protein [Hyphomicrobiaceae bacterium]
MSKLKMGALLAALALGGCSSGGITTGSILGVSAAKAPAAEDPSTRAIHVAATSAKALRCGYNFDTERLKASYLSWEGRSGQPPEQMGKIAQAYDFSYQSVTRSIPNAEAYCTDAVAREIKPDLTRYLAGDFTAPASAVVAAAPAAVKKVEPMDTARVFDPTGVRGPRP